MPNTKFDAKSFNPEAFKYVVDRVPNLKLNELKKSKALTGNPDIHDIFKSQNGTGYARIAMRGLADGDAVNYDGVTDITATSTKTFEQGVVVVGRAKGWLERDFSYDITGGIDFMQNIAQQIAEYKDELDQNTILHILTGIFNMTDNAQSREFVAKHTLNITNEAVNTMGATTLNNAMNKACGANKKKFSLVFMHSDVATGLENLNLLEHLRYTDKDGITRNLDLGTWNGKLVVIDDAMPLTQTVVTPGVNGVYTITISTKGNIGDKLTINNITYTFNTNSSYKGRTIAVGTSTTTQAEEIAELLSKQFAGVFSVSQVNNTIVLSQITPGTGTQPQIATIPIDNSEFAASITTTTQGVTELVDTEYITYILGEGAISYEDVGAKVPYEMARDPATHGGQDTLYIRQRKVFAPFGISYEKTVQASLSPTNEELSDGLNWTLVHSGETTESDRSYINHKAIAIARIISKG